MSFYDKFNKEELKILEANSNMSGMLKKKREKGVVSLFDSSVDRFFRFFCNGRFFVYYDKEPVACSDPVSYREAQERDVHRRNRVH